MHKKDDQYETTNEARMRKENWQLLAERIKSGRCTPFLGPSLFPPCEFSRDQIAQRWADEFKFPFGLEPTLHEIAQYLAVSKDRFAPHELITKQFENAKRPSFEDREDPYTFLANLSLPVYVTTYYDDFLEQELKTHQFLKDSWRREYSRWNKHLQRNPTIFEEGFKPGKANPMVYHLYGCADVPESLVLTQHDYLKFLENISKDQEAKVVPAQIDKAINRNYLLFMGYSFFDLHFLFLLQALDERMENNIFKGDKCHVSVQLDTLATTPEQQATAEKYLRKYFEKLDIAVCWGTCCQFISKLKTYMGDTNDD